MRISDWSSDVCSSDLFEHSSKLQNGEFVEFTMSSGFCLNPFSMIDEEEAKRDEDYRLDCIAMLKAIIGQMGRHIDRLDDTERGLIDAAVNAEWEAHGIRGSIDEIGRAHVCTPVTHAHLQCRLRHQKKKNHKNN